MHRILGIHAHPDDLEIVAGGTLALLAQAGHHISMVTMTAGDCGSAEHTPEEISRIRRQEAANSAALIGAEYSWAGFYDLAIFNNDESRRRVTEILRRCRPDVVITAAPVDYMTDHEATSTLVLDACFGAPAPLYRTGAEDPAPALASIPHLYFTSPLDSVLDKPGQLPPDFCVDVSGVFALKTQMLAQHSSQRRWLLRQHGMDDYLANMERLAAESGRRWGIALGEEFRHFKGHPYPASPLLETLLGPAVLTR